MGAHNSGGACAKLLSCGSFPHHPHSSRAWSFNVAYQFSTSGWCSDHHGHSSEQFANADSHRTSGRSGHFHLGHSWRAPVWNRRTKRLPRRGLELQYCASGYGNAAGLDDRRTFRLHSKRVQPFTRRSELGWNADLHGVGWQLWQITLYCRAIFRHILPRNNIYDSGNGGQCGDGKIWRANDTGWTYCESS